MVTPTQPRAGDDSPAESRIRPPLQRRSQESFERVLQAGGELIREAGYEGFTIHEVSRRSGISVGSIYARAPSKEALVLAIYQREMDIVSEANDRLRDAAQLDGLAPRELVVAAAEMTARSLLEHAEILRVFMHRAMIDPEIWRLGAARTVAHSQAFASALHEHRHEFTHPRPDLAIDVAFRIVFNTVARRITHGPDFESPHPLTDDELIRELGEAAADYLLAPREHVSGRQG